MSETYPGTAILSWCLFIDGLRLDKGGFVNAKAGVITAGFLRKEFRSTPEAKAAVCTFPELPVAKEHTTKVAIKRFRKKLFHQCLEFLVAPVHQFNRKGGVFLKLHGDLIYFR